MLAPRIEQEARAALERQLEPELLGPRAHERDLLAVEPERIELPDVGCDRERLVTDLGHELERLQHAVVREPVRVVAEAEHRSRPTKLPEPGPPVHLALVLFSRRLEPFRLGLPGGGAGRSPSMDAFRVELSRRTLLIAPTIAGLREGRDEVLASLLTRRLSGRAAAAGR